MAGELLRGRRRPYEVSAETESLIELLKRAEIGQEFSYATMSKTIGRDIRECRSVLYSALKAVQREYGFVFGNIRKTGVYRQDPETISKTGVATVQKINRAARREIRRQGTVDVTQLDDERKARHVLQLSGLGAISELSATRKLIEKPAKHDIEIDDEAMMKALSRPRRTNEE